ncbi:putative FAD-linked oxidoreductase [Sulfitobacter indolifex]|uniref:Glycolate oxidase, subunit GlcE n=1 Tax=Sulfitobacter indolifex HEL-45 TaxID=391624 RepID=A0ABM9XAL4_9RHOB|nr:FAD-binding protein [Sulfitobacter indolifex]EDQ06577.1 glycolate oxidase, subunit GlcE [Sulfitobacter indolifex HEL-45]UOA17567.1 putative FAD-linked oxidoreductase [Sulfitobacter indolifex]
MRVASESELVEAIRSAAGPLSLRGGNTRGMAGPGTALSLAGLRGITLYEPGALTLVAQAGTPVAEIEATLAAEGQRLAFEPMDHRALMGTTGEPTIGGVFAANVSGPRRLAVGAARDFLLGVRFVDGQGNVIKNGGRVMKNVTGYDLVKLLAGSRGTLGALTEVSLKVLPEPETSATLVLSDLYDPAAIAAMAQAMRSPFEVTAAAHDPAQRRTYLRLEGFEASVTYRIGRLKDLLAATGAALESLAAEPSITLWRDLRDVAAFHGAQGDVWRVHCRPTEAPALAAKAGAEAHLYDWAGGLIRLRMAPGTDLRARLGRYDGHATLLRADEAAQALPRQEPEAPGVARLTAGLRAKFDPRGIFNAEALALSP